VVRGLAIFQQWFQDFEDQYILIGGTAASITMTEAGLSFRATKDLDIVLHVEVLTPAFGQKFWEFDIVQLSALLQPGQVIDLPAKLHTDLLAFAKAVVELNRAERVQAMGRIASAYALDL
jgi:hypothetical protein